jgi:hypothetical protein
MHVIPELEKLRQEDDKFKDSVGYLGRSYLKRQGKSSSGRIQ